MRPSFLLVIFVLACGVLTLAVQPPRLGQAAEPEPALGRLIVLYEPAKGVLWSTPAGATRHIAREGVAVVESAPGGEEAAIAALRRDPAVRHVERDFVVRPQAEPNDPRYPEQWALAKVGAPTAWGVLTATSAITVAVIDSGVDLTHPEFAGRILPGWNFVERNASAHDDYGHGTHVAGIIAAAGNNHTGVAGMAWQTTILPIKVLNSSGAGYGSDLILAIDYARERGAKIINISLGTSANSVALQEAIDRAVAAGVLIVAAAGNTGASGNGIVYPGASRGVLSAAATDPNDRRASFSTMGSTVGVAAPGVGILSTYRGGSYTFMSGTSMASPMVAGLAALIWSQSPSLSAAQVRQQVVESSVDLGVPGRDDEFGAGRIDAAAWARRAVGLPLVEPTPTPPPATPTPRPSPTPPRPTPTAAPAYPTPSKPVEPERPNGSAPRAASTTLYLPIVGR